MTDAERRAMAATVEMLAESARDAARTLKLKDDPAAWRTFETSARALKRFLEIPLAERVKKAAGQLF